MSLDDDIGRGERAANLLQDETLQLAVQNIVDDCISRWRNSPARDAEARESIWRYLKVTDAVQAELRKFVDAGKLARVQVERERQQREFNTSLRNRAAAEAGIDPKYVE